MSYNKIIVSSAKKIEGTIEVPPDKSISHRAVMIGAIAEGTTEVDNFLMGEDCLRTIEAFREMGIKITQNPKPKTQSSNIVIEGRGLRGLREPEKELYLGNSGTTMRIILGILAGQDFECILTGDESLSKRPMKRVIEPLAMMGAEINARFTPQCSKLKDKYPPLRIKGRYPLKAIRYNLPFPSAQVKSAILLAGLYANGTTEVIEPVQSRDHTERMLKEFNANIKSEGRKISIEGAKLKSKGIIVIPGDISSAAFFIVAALILKSSKVTIKNLGVNTTRTGIIDILRNMGAQIELSNLKQDYFEPTADVTVKSSTLKGITIHPEIIPRLIDELPIIMVAAALSRGLTVIKGAGELRVKETDRIFSMTTNLKKMGADITVDGDDILINGPAMLQGAEVDSSNDHRTAMAMAIAGLMAEGKTTILNTACIKKSFPGFEDLVNTCSTN
ncbi:MAG: 3-phosphoshikimate 1-carboxyvinyltransferase [Candidatus Omnitrophica bacterium]|nr:3-phosphoshikimate 1-carboxyvinyltransferase [Candidatus Omnitrophota bacterium]